MFWGGPAQAPPRRMLGKMDQTQAHTRTGTQRIQKRKRTRTIHPEMFSVFYKKTRKHNTRTILKWKQENDFKHKRRGSFKFTLSQAVRVVDELEAPMTLGENITFTMRSLVRQFRRVRVRASGVV